MILRKITQYDFFPKIEPDFQKPMSFLLLSKLLLMEHRENYYSHNRIRDLGNNWAQDPGEAMGTSWKKDKHIVKRAPLNQYYFKEHSSYFIEYPEKRKSSWSSCNRSSFKEQPHYVFYLWYSNWLT